MKSALTTTAAKNDGGAGKDVAESKERVEQPKIMSSLVLSQPFTNVTIVMGPTKK